VDARDADRIRGKGDEETTRKREIFVSLREVGQHRKKVDVH
jgi:hypothetical protein